MSCKKPLAGYTPPHLLAGLAPDVPLLVALSGGADSVALLHMLHTWHQGPIYACHVHHGIRGAEADRDAEFCAALCKSLAVPLEVHYADVPALAAARGVGLESAARDARYAALEGMMAARDIPLLVTAHHADDQLETVLQHLLRGAGARGLCGIPALRPLEGGRLVARPLLRLAKREILAYCAQNELSFVTDSTNLEPCCPRNRLRAEVLPVLEELWPGGAERAARCAAALAQDEAYFAELADDFLQKEGDRPLAESLCALPRPVLVRVLQKLLPTVPEAAHLEAMVALLQKARPHASLSLPGVRVQIERGRFCVLPAIEDKTKDFSIELAVGENPLPQGLGLAILGAYGENFLPEGIKVYKYATRVDFCSAIINGRLVLRNRRAGDRILSGGMHKSVRKLPCMAPFSPTERARMPLLCDGEGVLAVPFGPVRDGAKRHADKSLYLFFD